MRFTKKIFTILPIILFLFLFFNKSIVKASEPKFFFYPPGGTVINKNQGFVVDILIDTGGQEVTSAKFVVTFDPRVLQLTKAERNNSLFDKFPEDESSLDNENGVIMLTGFTQSGSRALYVTTEKPDVFARLTFSVLQEGETTLDWVYGESNTTFSTLMYKEGSPPQNILIGSASKPEPATFRIGNVILDPSTVDTAVPIDKYILVTGLVLVLFGGFMVFTKPGGIRKRRGTVVVYDEE